MNLFPLAAKQQLYKKAYLLTENTEFSGGQKAAEWASRQKRVAGLGRGTREEIVKWNQMTALRFQTWGRH